MATVVKWFTAWSYSRYKDWLKCPRFAFWNHILKYPIGEKSPAMLRGADVHKQGERFFQIEPKDWHAVPRGDMKLYEKVGVIRRLKKLPEAYAKYRKEMEALRKAKATSEGQRAVDARWTPSEWYDMARTWLRVVYDAKLWDLKARVVRIVDFKTGKIYPDDNDDQMELYACVGFAEHPDALEVQVELWYLDQPRKGGDEDDRNPRVRRFLPKDAAKLRKKWEAKVAPMMRDRRFPPTPGRECNRCPYSKRKGGKCEY